MNKKYTITIPITDGVIWVDKNTCIKPDTYIEALNRFQLEYTDVTKVGDEITSIKIVGISLVHEDE